MEKLKELHREAANKISYVDYREDMQNWGKKNQNNPNHLTSVPGIILEMNSKEYHVWPCAVNFIKAGVNVSFIEGSYISQGYLK